jgi:hypothetical protein
LAGYGFFTHDLGVILNIGGGRHALHEGGQPGHPSHSFQIAGPLELVGEGDHVHGLAAVVHFRDGPIQAPVHFAVKVFFAQDLDRGFDGVTRKKHGAQHRLLRL